MITNFRKALGREIAHIETLKGLKPDKAFIYWFATQILEIDEMAALEAISVEGSNDKGIDLFYVDDDNERIIIGQGKYTANLDYRPIETRR